MEVKISVGKKGLLSLGDNFTISAESSLVCQKEIFFGDSCLLSWDILVMDTDFHEILNMSDEIINEPSSIRIGNHVWIGCRTLILKGISIGDNNVIAANSTITKSIKDTNCVCYCSGKNQEILRRDITWRS